MIFVVSADVINEVFVRVYGTKTDSIITYLKYTSYSCQQ